MSFLLARISSVVFSRITAYLLVVMAIGLSRAAAQVNLVDPDWIVTGSDSVNWNGSRLYFTSQAPAGSGYTLDGYADWYSNGIYHGRELFTGSLSSSLHIDFTGFQLINPNNIILGHYQGTVTADGLNIVNGTWQGVTGISNGVWSAARTRIPGAYCFGAITNCPCSNGGILGNGCANSVSGIGAHLAYSGVASISADSLTLTAMGMPNGTALFVQSSGVENGGVGSPFGDGLQCLSGSIIHLAIRDNVGGISVYPGVGGAPISIQGQVINPSVRAYQVWYRNDASFCTGATFNTTNGLLITWTP